MLHIFRRLNKKINPDVPPRQGLFLSLVYEDTFTQVIKNLPGLIAVSLPWTTIAPIILMFLSKGKSNPGAFFALSILTSVMINVYLLHFDLPTGKRILKTLTGSWRLYFMILFSFLIASAPVGIILFGIGQLVKIAGKPAMPLMTLGIFISTLFMMIIVLLIIPTLVNESGKKFYPLKRILFLIRKQKLRILGCMLLPWIVYSMFLMPMFRRPTAPAAPPSIGMIISASLLFLLITILFNALYAFIYQHLKAEAGEDYPEYITGPVPGEKIV